MTTSYRYLVHTLLGAILLPLLGVSLGAGFDFYGLWTVKQNIKLGDTYVSSSSVDDAAMGTVLAQLGLGNDDFQADPTFENLFRILETSEGLIQTDILTLVERADDRGQALESHIRAIEAIRYETADVAVGYQEMANRFLEESNACLVRKNAGDAEFFEGVQQANKVLATRGYEQSLEAAPCYITNRIKANAMTYLNTRTQTYSQLLARRQQILRTNQEMIITYPELLQTDLASRLLATQRDLQSLKSVSFGQVQGTFGDFTSSATKFLPNYFQVFFPGKRPTYFDPQISLQ